MEWKIDYLEQDGIVYMKTSGPASWEDIRKMSKKAMTTASSNNSHKFLVDHRIMEPGLSTLQIDDLPGMLKEVGVTGDDKVAIIFDPSSQAQMSNSFSFFINSAIIESLQVRLFADPKEAIAWLKSDEFGPDERERGTEDRTCSTEQI